MGPYHNLISLFNLYYILALLCNQVHITSTAAAEFPAAACVLLKQGLIIFRFKHQTQR